MNRKLLIIGAPGGIYSTNITGSVNADIKKIKKDFQLPQFGAWTLKEMKVLPDATLSEIMAAKKEMKADYSIIIFTGHAGTNLNGQRILNLTNGEWLRDTDLLNGNDRELILVDGCGSWTQTGIAGLSEEESRYSNFLEEDYSKVRAVYNHWIGKCGKAKLILHATMPGQTAAAAPYGGVFLTSLLNASSKFKGEVEKYKLLTIESSALAVHKELGDYKKKQTPAITFRQGDTANLPFAIGLPLPKPQPKKESNYAPLVLGLLGIGAIALIAGSSD